MSVWTLVIARRLYDARISLVRLPELSRQLLDCVERLAAAQHREAMSESEIAKLRGEILGISASCQPHASTPALRAALLQLSELRTEHLDGRTVSKLIEGGTQLAQLLEGSARDTSLRT